MAALAALAAVSWLGVAGDQLPLGEWPLAIGATGALHVALAAMLYEPVVRLLLAGNARAIVPFALAASGLIPLLLLVSAFADDYRRSTK